MSYFVFLWLCSGHVDSFLRLVEAVVLSSFILMRQNRTARRAERRDHLNLQIDLIAEKEITKLLQMVRATSSHLGVDRVADDQEPGELGSKMAILLSGGVRRLRAHFNR